MKKQVEAQRLEFKQQLEDQRKALEAQNSQCQRELEARFQAQITQAIQAHISVSPSVPTPPPQVPNEVNRRMESQDARIQQLTDMIQQLVTNSPSDSTLIIPQRSSTGKRQAPPQVVIDLLVMDHEDLESASYESVRHRAEKGAKKQGTKVTPRQDLSGNNMSIKVERTDSPIPSELSMSMMEPASQAAESLLWNGLHPPSEVYSPRAFRTGIGMESPLSNLALHPKYRSPSHNFPSDHSTEFVNDHFKDISIAPSFGESTSSEAHMRDIHAQHQGLQGFNIHNGDAERPYEAEQEPAKGPIEDDKGTHQAILPVEGSTNESDHEGSH
jgi:hypothetical protein